MKIKATATYELTRKCPFCGGERTLAVNAIKYAQYKMGMGKVQDIFPKLSADDREFLITGICPDCCKRVFGAEE